MPKERKEKSQKKIQNLKVISYQWHLEMCKYFTTCCNSILFLYIFILFCFVVVVVGVKFYFFSIWPSSFRFRAPRSSGCGKVKKSTQKFIIQD